MSVVLYGILLSGRHAMLHFSATAATWEMSPRQSQLLVGSRTQSFHIKGVVCDETPFNSTFIALTSNEICTF